VTVFDTVAFITDNKVRSWLNQSGMHVCKNISHKFTNIFYVKKIFQDEVYFPSDDAVNMVRLAELYIQN
jgi:hypothetical protein